MRRCFFFCVPFILFIGSLSLSAGEEDEAEGKKNKEITIAVIGNTPPGVPAGADAGEIVRRVCAFWQGRFDQVLPDRPDLIVVPEVCDRPAGFSGKKLFAWYEKRGNRVRDFFAAAARKNRCYITYPAVRKLEDGTWRNSITLLGRDGEVVGVYDKNHPTIGELESGILPGRKAVVLECDFGRVGFAICFDLNFMELKARYAKARPDLIVFCSMYHGGLVQEWWAYSCRCHFVGAISRRCPSEIRNPLGEVLASNTNYFDFTTAKVNLDCELVHLDYNWGRLTALKKKYGKAVEIKDPGLLASVLVTSFHETKDVDVLLDEFEIERLDHYLDRARKAKKETERKVSPPRKGNG